MVLACVCEGVRFHRTTGTGTHKVFILFPGTAIAGWYMYCCIHGFIVGGMMVRKRIRRIVLTVQRTAVASLERVETEDNNRKNQDDRE